LENEEETEGGGRTGYKWVLVLVGYGNDETKQIFCFLTRAMQEVIHDNGKTKNERTVFI
jgi:hypothetical protein